jgi:hypothetical protein
MAAPSVPSVQARSQVTPQLSIICGLRELEAIVQQGANINVALHHINDAADAVIDDLTKLAEELQGA